MTKNTRSNNWIKRFVIIGDFVLLNLVLYVFSLWHPSMTGWEWEKLRIFFLVANLAMLISEWHRHTIIHRRLVFAGEMLKRVCQLIVIYTLIAYLIMKGIYLHVPVGKLLIVQGVVLFVVTIMTRFVERSVIKYYRRYGGNTRAITFVGDDPELELVKGKLLNDPTFGYRVLAEYKDASDFIRKTEEMEDMDFGDELYLCVSRLEKDIVKRISNLCDQHLVGFFYVPLSVESLGINLKREMLDEIDIYTNYEQPLQGAANHVLKRVCDVAFSMVSLIPTALIFPIVWLIVKIQSPGPVFFKQQRTGLDGKSFTMYKFRSMHVNVAADKQQATKDDPRKFPFGSFMRRMSIDELPQLWNVLKGDMSIIGPRPHMIAHTEEYSQLIDKYMVRHFVKPGMTGWAQVTGFRGETKELWQMEERVKRDIWYMENWSIWLDLRIIWLTVKSLLVRQENAY